MSPIVKLKVVASKYTAASRFPTHLSDRMIGTLLRLMIYWLLQVEVFSWTINRLSSRHYCTAVGILVFHSRDADLIDFRRLKLRFIFSMAD